MKALQERYKDDKQKQQQEMHERCTSTEKVNPLAGCLPILLQIPIFYALYKVLLLTIEMRHQPFVAVDQGSVGARPADAGQPVRPARLHAAALHRDRRAADPARRVDVASSSS
jgi:YidC/Oxa1 family membrane protein insertase